MMMMGWVSGYNRWSLKSGVKENERLEEEEEEEEGEGEGKEK